MPRYGRRVAKRGEKEMLAQKFGKCMATPDGKILRDGVVVKQYLNSTGYFHFGICRKSHLKALTHRYVWHYFNGPIPEDMVIDHINRDPTDNRIENLRCVSRSDNMKNRAPWYVKGQVW